MPSIHGNRLRCLKSAGTAPANQNSPGRLSARHPRQRRYRDRQHGYESLQWFEDGSAQKQKILCSQLEKLAAQASSPRQRPCPHRAAKRSRCRALLNQPPSFDSSGLPQGALAKSRVGKGCRPYTKPDFQARYAKSRLASAYRNNPDQCNSERLDCRLRFFSFRPARQPRHEGQEDRALSSCECWRAQPLASRPRGLALRLPRACVVDPPRWGRYGGG